MVSEVRKALQVEKDHMRHLIEHIRQIEAEMPAPTLKLLLGRLREVGNRLTGGGLRALANRILKTLLPRIAAHRKFAPTDRSVSKPFAAQTKNRPCLGTAEEMPAARARPLASNSAPTPNELTASARCIYEKLRNTVSVTDELNRVQ
jgi:hypothetical protein